MSARIWRTLFLAGTTLLALGACGDGAVAPRTDPPADDVPEDGPEDADPARLVVTHISLLPRIPPPEHVGAPPDAGWPDPGQDVTWVGHVYNSGDETAEDVPFRWLVDGEEVGDGTVDLPAGETRIELPRTWAGSRREISLTLESSPGTGLSVDHTLTVRSDGLSLTLWMDARLAERFEGELNLGPFQVWAAGEVRAWNAALAGFTSSEGPPAILDRIRLDIVEIVSPGTPYPRDITTDLMWYFRPSSNVPYPRTIFVDNDVFLHELLHQRGITDLYAYFVQHESPNGSEVLIREPDGSLAAGGPRMPLLPFLAQLNGGVPYYLFVSPYRDRLMGDEYNRPVRIDPHTAYGLNMRTGLRTPRWIDEVGNIRWGWTRDGNDYLRRVPDRMRLHVVVDGEEASAGTRVEAFFDHHRELYHNRHGPDPDVVAETGQDGSVVIPLDGLLPPVDWDTGSDVVILRVTEPDGSRWDYAFLPVYELNMAYFHGAHEVADLTVEVEPI